MSSQPTVAVDGATGYLGSHLVWQLRQAGMTVRCIVHPGARERDLQFLRSTGAEIHTASLSQPDGSLDAALTGSDVVVHLIGSIAPRKGERLEDLHGAQTANLVKAAKASGVKKIVQVTALGTAAGAASSYHATKWQAEEFVRNSGLQWIILRPSLIVGKQVGNRDSKLIARYRELIRTRPAVPVIGGGKNKLQPVFIADLTAALQKSIVDPSLNNGAYEIGGSQVLEMKEIVEKLMALEGVQKRIAALPPFAAGLLAAACETFQNVPLISRDQIKLSTADNVCQDNALESQFGIQPTPIDKALQSYMQPAGQAQATAR